MQYLPPLPRLSAALPGIGGHLKQTPEDFVVEEIPAYEPSGHGEHLYLWLEKRGLSADALARHLARTLQIRREQIGVAGLKDTVAIARQMVSVPARCEDDLAQAETAAVRVLWARRHDHKLRAGHLKGNRFEVRVRRPLADAAARALPILERLRRRGVPNYYGVQRFGASGETAQLGFSLLRGDVPQVLKRAPRAKRRFLTRLALSSAQSALFNTYLSDRARAGLLHRVLAGDVMLVCRTGGPFVAEDPEKEQSRFDAHEVMPAGPMFGPKMRRAFGEALAREESVLARAGLSIDTFAAYTKLTPGTRRQILVWPEGLAMDEQGESLLFTFSLPSGSYATVVMEEILKGENGEG